MTELMDKASSQQEAGLKSLMNLVMQLRKVDKQAVCVPLHLALKLGFYSALQPSGPVRASARGSPLGLCRVLAVWLAFSRGTLAAIALLDTKPDLNTIP